MGAVSSISWGDGTVEESSGAGEAWTACFGPPPHCLPLWICLEGPCPEVEGLSVCGGPAQRPCHGSPCYKSCAPGTQG